MEAEKAIDSALAETDRLRSTLKKGSNRQIRSMEERTLMKAVSMSWFRNHRKPLAAVGLSSLGAIDEFEKQLLASSEINASRDSVVVLLRDLRAAIARARLDLTDRMQHDSSELGDSPPLFSPLIADAAMRSILQRRWTETVVCLKAGAPLAAVVMMGGLLEALLLARVNQTQEKASVFTCKSAPREKSTGKTLPLREWGLRDYIDVAHELKWITQSARDVSAVLRDYRNYIHPQKEYAHAVVLGAADAALLWGVARSIAEQVVEATA